MVPLEKALPPLCPLVKSKGARMKFNYEMMAKLLLLFAGQMKQGKMWGSTTILHYSIVKLKEFCGKKLGAFLTKIAIAYLSVLHTVGNSMGFR